MLIELVKVAKDSGHLCLADVRTPLGRILVRWCGDRAAEPGEYRVEWTIDEDIVWGQNAKPAAGIGPGLRTDGHDVVLRGRLSLTEDGAAVLGLDGTNILLDLADPLPEDVADRWVEIFIDRERTMLYPYTL
ncbi:hypothetical protein AB0K23_25010 [Streptomyces sp. NPDC049602]|uniref:hypothetical protein n=1 Tax=Streptomyces sp. NPDC049602 TaxID=3155504 RepID=UPI00341A0330